MRYERIETRIDERRRVVVGVDNDQGSVVALRCAAEEARRSGAVLVVVAAWSPFGGEVAERTYPCPELDASQRAAAHRVLDSACERAPLPDDVVVERRVERGPLGPVLVALADGQDDLLVVGLRFRQAFGRLRSSVDRYCKRHAAAPVLVVPPHWEAPAVPALAA
ncbi:universal stress protein [Streptomyces sp. IBSBF 3136]|uniref:universal stress protein n=1 Tax=Streptomyces sp. IBSBF 3136 TaxID=2903524 RepID=UPI002FDBCCF2